MSHNDLYDFEVRHIYDRFMRAADREKLKKFYDAYWECLEDAYEATGWRFELESERDEKVYEMISELVIDSLSWEWH